MSDTKDNHSREFSTGARRDSEEGKLRYHAVLSPYALDAWTDYCRRHNSQVHRREENWKKGMPLESFLGSMFRHFMHVWVLHEQLEGAMESEELDETFQEICDALCGVLFNAHGYLHELTKPEPRTMYDEHIIGNVE